MAGERNKRKPPPDARPPSQGADADPERSRRSIETARELGGDESEEALERIFARIVVRPRKPGEPPTPNTAPGKGAGRRKRTASGG